MNKDNYDNDDLNINNNRNNNNINNESNTNLNPNKSNNLDINSNEDFDEDISMNNHNQDLTENPTDFNFESSIKYSSNRQSATKLNSTNIFDSQNKNIPKIEKKATLKEAFMKSEFYIFFKVWLNINRWGLFVYIIIVSFCVVFFVSNVRTVTKLLDDIVKLNKYRNEINSKNKILEVKLVEMQSPERINKIAIEKLGLEKATEAPFYIDKSKK